MQVALIGLPLSGKTTLCNAMTAGHAEKPGQRAGRGEVRSAVVNVPDPRVAILADLFHPRKVTYAQVRFDDISGVSRGSSEVSGFDTRLLDAMSRADALLQIIRAFDDDRVPHPELTIDPARDVEIVTLELIVSDLATVERRLERIANGLLKTRGDQAEKLLAEESLMRRLADGLSQGIAIRDMVLTPAEQLAIRGFQFLTAKPTLVVLNLSEDAEPQTPTEWAAQQQEALVLGIRGMLEMEIAQLPAEERAIYLESYGIAEPSLNVLVRECYRLLGLMSFFTVGEDEVRAWTVQRGATAVEAASVIHTDLARGFIRAEVIGYEEMIACGTLAEARKQGKLRLEGKDYVVQDGDILNIRFNV
jgi:ribosome-binding ATPase